MIEASMAITAAYTPTAAEHPATGQAKPEPFVADPPDLVLSPFLSMTPGMKRWCPVILSMDLVDVPYWAATSFV